MLSIDDVTAVEAGKSYEDDAAMYSAELKAAGSCSVCGFTYDVCQSPPVDLMDCYDERQSPTKLRMVREGVIGGDSMSDDEKLSFDSHYPASGGVITEPWSKG